MADEQIPYDWWKWGEPHKRKSLTDYPRFLMHLEERWKKKLQIKLPHQGEPKLLANNESAETIKKIFERQLPGLLVSTVQLIRLKRSVGKSYPELVIAATCGEIHLVDAVLFPTSHEEVISLLKICTGHKIIVIPFGGGTNVVGALRVNRPADQLTVSVDLSRMKNLLSLDVNNHVAVFQAGVFGPEVENILNEKGFTLGHFPQSFEYSTLGGWIATRSGGQESSAYGKIEDMVISLKIAVGAGTIATSDFENDAAGINIKSLFFGAEGSLGIVTAAKLLIHPVPKYRKWITALFADFESGLFAVQALIQSGIFPAVLRYSDQQETYFLSLMSEHRKNAYDTLKAAMIKRMLKSKKLNKPCLLVIRMDGTKEAVARNGATARPLLKKHNGFLTGEQPGLKWASARFGLPYLVDDMIERDIFVDTVETVLPWDKINMVKTMVTKTLFESEAFQKEKGILLTHISHVYYSAASIYFTIITERNSDPYHQWKTIKSKVLDIIMTAGGAVSHHHSIGTDLKEWYVEKTDVITKDLLATIKNKLDPAHILNPGKLSDE